jgi:hypothetical protein
MNSHRYSLASPEWAQSEKLKVGRCKLTPG